MVIISELRGWIFFSQGDCWALKNFAFKFYETGYLLLPNEGNWEEVTCSLQNSQSYFSSLSVDNKWEVEANF